MPAFHKDNYLITDQTIKEPPVTFFQKLKFLGPGFILSASIVGSGELIATTTLGAKAGFIAFWVILISCLVKVAVQLEFGKHTILTGETAMQILNKLSGPRIGKGKWILWFFFLLLLLKLVQLGGMVGSTGIVLTMLFPGIPTFVWVFISAFIASALIYKGYYKLVEKLALFMTAMFTVFTITAVTALYFTPYSISWDEIASGLTFSFPPEIIAVAIGAFGITGVASDEIIAYNYWCLEKGYAAYTGPRQNTEAWRKRADGWIRVMYLDAIIAMIIYTLVTAAFYLLGAAILNDRGVIPEGNQLIETVALIYTESLGPGARMIYLVGAFFVLFSSVFATLAFNTRIYPDIFGQLGWVDFSNVIKRNSLIAVLAWAIPAVWAITYLFLELPVAMILFGGVVGSIMLFLVAYTAIHIKLVREDLTHTGMAYNIAFWISIIAIVGVGAYGMRSLF